MTDLVSLLIAMIPIDCKTTTFPHTCLLIYFGNNYNIWWTHKRYFKYTPLWKKEWPRILFSRVAYQKVYMPASFLFAYACPIAQNYKQRRARKVSLLATIWPIRKIHLWQHVHPGSISHSEKAKWQLRFVFRVAYHLQSILSKRIAS